MATRKVARSKLNAQPALTFTVHSTEEGEAVARVFERSSRTILAVARGSATYARRASRVFAATWSEEQSKLADVIRRHEAAAERLRRTMVLRASNAVRLAVGGAS
jgi:hypothetical protein